MNKLKFILAASLAATLTLSCTDLGGGGGEDPPSSSSDGGVPSGGGSSSSVGSTTGSKTETYTLIENGSNGEYFSYSYSYEYDVCSEGRFETRRSEPTERYQSYSIRSNTMTWGDESDAYWGDTIQFKGTSNNLTGIWTRTRSSCDLNNDPYGGDDNLYCKTNYDITKAVFTATTVAITQEECPTDIYTNGDIGSGWTRRVVNCNTMEMSKGSDKITEKRTATSSEISYRGNSCKWENTIAKKQTACRTAWDRYSDNDFEWVMNNDFQNCLVDLLPEEFFAGGGGDYCDYYPEDCGGGYDYCYDYPDDPDCEDYWGWGTKIAAKPALKAKAQIKTNAIFKLPLLKK